MSEYKDVQKLIALKRYEQPSDEYFDQFLDEFRQRQRQELLNKSARGILFERVQTWMNGLGKQGWVYGAGVAYAVVMLGFFLIPQSQEQPVSPVASDTFPSAGEMGNASDVFELPSMQDDGVQAVSFKDRLRLIEIDESEPVILNF